MNKSNPNLYVVLMAGGVGTRFWPYSRMSQPKQFLDVLNTGKTLLQSTYERFVGLCPPENILVITHEEHVALTQQQLPALLPAQIVAEPMRKNTAPCILYAARKIRHRNPQAVMVVSPSDHLITQEEEFRKTVGRAVAEADSQNNLITLGIQPTRPETGYGYIQYITGKNAIKKVKTFTEKPELALARKFVDSGDFVWNSGIFIWGVQAILQAFARHLPEMTEVFEEVDPVLDTPDEAAAMTRAYAQCKNISIDYGILEKADNVFVALSTFGWSDLGSWASLHDHSQRDDQNNALEGQTMLYEVRNSVVKAPEGTLVVAQGLNGYLVGVFGNVVIVCEKDKEELFRRFITDLKTRPDGNEFL